jgi:membrane-associated protease RseP (regulator of RpoE activity)
VSTTDAGAFLGVSRQDVLATQGLPGAVGSSVVQFGKTVGASVAGVARVLWPPNLLDFFASTVDDQPKDTSSTPTPAAQAPSTSGTERPVSIIGIVALGDAMTSESWSYLIQFLIGINIVLGVFNLIPLLPFDGGHVAIAVYEKAQELRRRQRRRYIADVTKMLPVAYGVVMALVVISFAAMYLDVTRGVGT